MLVAAISISLEKILDPKSNNQKTGLSKSKREKNMQALDLIRELEILKMKESETIKEFETIKKIL